MSLRPRKRNDGPRTIEHYRIIRILSEGVAGTLYLAEDPHADGRKVVIKAIEPDKFLPPAQRGPFRLRQRQNAEAMKRVSHPVLPQICQVLERESTLYIVTEYADGKTLADTVAERGALPVGRIVEMALSVLGALEALHREGIVHQDISLASVVVTGDGSVKLVDVGLASNVAPDGLQTQADADPDAVRNLAPEQFAGQAAGPASNIFSMGAVLYELLTGQGPFQTGTSAEIAYSILYEPPPDIRSLNPGIAEALAAVVAKALAKAPGDRFGSAADMARALEAAVADPSRGDLLLDPGIGHAVAAAETVAVENSRRDGPRQSSDSAPASDAAAQSQPAEPADGAEGPCGGNGPAPVRRWCRAYPVAIAVVAVIAVCCAAFFVHFGVSEEIVAPAAAAPVIRGNAGAVGVDAKAAEQLGELKAAFYAKSEGPEGRPLRESYSDQLNDITEDVDNAQTAEQVNKALARLGELSRTAREGDARIKALDAEISALLAGSGKGLLEKYEPGVLASAGQEAATARTVKDHERVLAALRSAVAKADEKQASARSALDPCRQRCLALRDEAVTAKISDDTLSGIQKRIDKAGEFASNGAYAEATAECTEATRMLESAIAEKNQHLGAARERFEQVRHAASSQGLALESVRGLDASIKRAEEFSRQRLASDAAGEFDKCTALIASAVADFAARKKMELQRSRYNDMRNSPQLSEAALYLPDAVADLDKRLAAARTADECDAILAELARLPLAVAEGKAGAQKARALFDAERSQINVAYIRRSFAGELEKVDALAASAVTAAQCEAASSCLRSLQEAVAARMEADPTEAMIAQVLSCASRDGARAVDLMCGELVGLWETYRHRDWQQLLALVRDVRLGYAATAEAGLLRLNNLEKKVAEYQKDELMWNRFTATLEKMPDLGSRIAVLEVYRRDHQDSLYRKDAERLYEKLRDEMARSRPEQP